MMIKSSEWTDENILQAIVDGQSSALGMLYDRYGRLVFSLAANIFFNNSDAEEITQEVFLLVWKNASTYRTEQGRVGAWLSSITRHRAFDALRRKGARPDGHRLDWVLAVEEPDLPDDSEPVENIVEDHQQAQQIRKVVSSLPVEQQQVLLLAYFQGMTQEEIAAQTGEPLGTVKTRIRLAMQKLRSQMAEIS
jgi:RNA polymerase sigma-70 factor (ECF subfamily)